MIVNAIIILGVGLEYGIIKIWDILIIHETHGRIPTTPLKLVVSYVMVRLFTRATPLLPKILQP